MPFAVVHGMPLNMDIEFYSQIRREIVEVMFQAINSPWHSVKRSSMTVFMPVDLLDEPETPEDGGKTIYCRIDTALLTKPLVGQDEAIPGKLTSGVAKVLWDAFNGDYEVEVFIGHLELSSKTLLKPKAKVS